MICEINLKQNIAIFILPVIFLFPFAKEDQYFTKNKNKNTDVTNVVQEKEFVEVVSQTPKKVTATPKANVKPKPKITAPKPATYKVDNAGRLVCGKKNDKPKKSSKNKKLHLDMECCLDPNEIPNPHCYYPRSAYGKFLDKYNSKK
jgi:hypothetical protein